jgi:hypothetical protein
MKTLSQTFFLLKILDQDLGASMEQIEILPRADTRIKSHYFHRIPIPRIAYGKTGFGLAIMV